LARLMQNPPRKFVVRFWRYGCTTADNVRFTPKSGHWNETRFAFGAIPPRFSSRRNYLEMWRSTSARRGRLARPACLSLQSGRHRRQWHRSFCRSSALGSHPLLRLRRRIGPRGLRRRSPHLPVGSRIRITAAASKRASLIHHQSAQLGVVRFACRQRPQVFPTCA